MTWRKQKLFLSYAWKDDQAFVERLHRDLKRLGYEPWMDTKNMTSRGRSLPREVEQQLDQCSRVLAVMGPEAIKSEACLAEREFALSKGKVVNAILRLGEYKMLPREVSEYFVPDFRVSRDYESALCELHRVLQDPAFIPGHLYDVPARPAHLQHRSSEVRRLQEAITAASLKPVAITAACHVALHGMAGVGKTVLAALVARDYTVRRAFQNGIVWITLGRRPQLLRELRKVGAIFKDDLAEYTTIPMARQRLAQLLNHRECLLILDDVWHATHAEPFMRAVDANPRCRLLLTTRNLEVVTATGAKSHVVDVLAEHEALELLGNWSGQNSSDLPIEARHVASECGNLPLALAMVGAMVRTDSGGWSGALNKLRRADLEKIRQSFPDYPYPSLMRAIEVSVLALNSQLLDRYLDLAVCPRNLPVPIAMLETFWAPLGWQKDDTRDATDQICRLSLARRNGDDAIVLHDLQLDYVRHKVGTDNLHILHQRLVDSYRLGCSDGWHSMPNDGYMYRNLAYHLVQGGYKEELRGLLVDFAWLYAKLNATDSDSLVNDYELLQDNQELAPIVEAIRLSSHILERDREQLASQLTNRLLNLADRLLTPAGISTATLVRSIERKQSRPWIRSLLPSLTQVGGALIRSIAHDGSDPTWIQLDASGEILLSGSAATGIRVWNVNSGKVRLVLEDRFNYPAGLAMSADARAGLSASSFGELKVWDLTTGKVRRTLQKDARENCYVSACALSADGKLAATASTGGTLTLWDVAKGISVRSLRVLSKNELGTGSQWGGATAAPDAVVSLAVSSQHSIVLAGFRTGKVQVWDYSETKPDWTAVHELRDLGAWGKDKLIAVALTPDGRLALSASEHGALKAWDIGRQVASWSVEPRKRVWSLGQSWDGQTLLLGCWDGSLILFDTKTGAEVSRSLRHHSSARSVALSADARVIVSSGERRFQLWHTEQPHISSFQAHADWVRAVAITKDGRLGSSGSFDGELKIWDLEARGVKQSFQAHSKSITALAFTNENRLVSASDDGTIKIWSCSAGRLELTLDAKRGIVFNIWVSDDGSSIVSYHENMSTIVWSVENACACQTYPWDVAGHVLWSDGKIALSSSRERLKLWDLGKAAESFSLHEEQILYNRAVVSQDGRRIILGFEKEGDGILQFWNVTDHTCVGALSRKSAKPTDIALSRSSEAAISAWTDGSFVVCNSKNGTVIASFDPGEGGGLWCCDTSEDGRTFIAGAGQGRVHLFRLEKS